MSTLDEISVFVAVIQAGSFTRAAQNLGLPKSTVSRKVSLLEERLGVTLLHRTTRKLHLTDVGARYYRSCTRTLSELAQAEEEAKSTQSAPKGHLRITAPVELGTTLLEDVLAGYLKAHPEVEIELLLTDQVVDLVEEGVDIAIRAGRLEDSSFVAKKLGSDEFRLYASPAYLKKAGTPTHPRELIEHACLVFTTQAPDGRWRLESEKAQVRLDVPARLGANSLGVLLNLAIRAEGIALLPAYLAREAVSSGKLTRVLPAWSSGREPLYLVYPRQRFVPPKVREFITKLIPNTKGDQF